MNDSPLPVTVTGLTHATAISAADLGACALLDDGSVACWGNLNGTTYKVPWQVPGVSGATAISVGATVTCALLRDGTVKCWGSNQYGQLGDGTGVDSLEPVTVAFD